jgi:glycosyltransferase involved in cell wall biosynthesis
MNNAVEPTGTTGRPVISIVMPVLNAAATIGAALDSVAGQTFELEAIIADGGSTDATVAIAGRFPFARVLPAPGSSIYEALNLALAAARAPILAWLNADDLFVAGALVRALDAFAAAPEAEIVRGTAQFRRSDAAGWQGREDRIEARAAGPLSLDLITRGPLAINSMLFRREVLTRIGPFDTSFRLAADREWMLRAWCRGVRVLELKHPVYCYRVHRGSSTLDPGRRNHLRVREEHIAILAQALPPALRLDPGAPVRIALRRWHAIECARLLRALPAAGGWRRTFRFLTEAVRRDPAWPLILAGEAAAKLLGRRAGHVR